jgi:hypothetical protein
MFADIELIDVSPKRADNVIVVMVAVGAVKFPPTATPLFVVTVLDSVVIPVTTSEVADKLVVVVPDSVVNPKTLRLFWMVAADTVRRPLIPTALVTLREDRVAVTAPADKVLPFRKRLLFTVAADTVRRPLIPTAFATLSADRVAVALPADSVLPFTNKLF